MANPLKQYKVGSKLIEARNMGEALGMSRALKEAGEVGQRAKVGEVILEEGQKAPLGKVAGVEEAKQPLGKVKMVPAVAAPAMTGASPMEALRGLGQAWQSAVVDPISASLKSTLTPPIQAGRQQYETASPVSDMILDTAADPINYVPGSAGAVLGGAEAVANFADGGMVQPNMGNEMPTPGIEIYDMSGSTPVLGTIDPSEVQAAIESGQFQLPVNRKVDVISPDGTLGTIVPSEASEAFKSGFKFATPDQAKYGQMPVTAAVLGAVDSATFGLAGAIMDPIAEAMGAPKDERLKIAQQNEGARLAGQIAGMLTPAGAAAAGIGKMGAAALGLGEATAAARVGSLATRAAIENMVFSGSDETAKMFMGVPDQSVETALTNIGLSGAIGGALGGAFGAVPELWKLGQGRKVSSLLDGIKLSAEGKPTAELAKLQIMAAPEIDAALSQSPMARARFQELMQSDTVAGRHTQELLTKFTDSLDDATVRTLGRTADDVADLSIAKTGEGIKNSLDDVISKRYEPIAKSYDDLEAKFGTAVVAPETREIASGKLQQLVVDEGLLKSKAAAPMLKIVSEAIEDLPKQANAQDLRVLVKNTLEANPHMSPGSRIAKQVARIINEAQDNTLLAAADSIGDSAGAMFRSTQSEYRLLRETMEDLNDYLSAGLRKGEGVGSFTDNILAMDPETVAKRLSQDKVQLAEVLEQSFPEVAEKVKQYKYDSLIDKAKVGDRIDTKKLSKLIDALEPETKTRLFTPEQLAQIQSIANLKDRIPKNMNPSGTAKTIAGILAQPAAGLAGLLLGGASGGAGAMLAAMGLKEGSAAAKLAMLRFLGSSEPTNAAAFKQALGMAAAVEKGEQVVNKAVRDVFTGKVKTEQPNTTKLKKLVEEYTQDESKFMKVGADLGHYLPDQAGALSMAAVRNIRYLASQRPNTAPLSPFDAARKVSDTEEAKYDRALQIAERPLLILDGVQQGRINPQDMQHLRQMYPALANSLATKLQMQVIEHKGENGRVPFKTQMGLSAYLGQPLSSNLQPQAIQASQPQQASMESAQGQPVRKTTGMPKLGQAYQTPSQVRQTRQQRH